MVDAIERALNPLFLAIFFFGFGILRYPLGHPRLRLSILYILILWSVYGYVFYYVLIPFSSSTFKSFKGAYILMTNLLVTMISIIINIRENEKFYACIKNLGLVNDTLEKLGTPKEYHRMQNLIKWMLIVWFMIICITLTVDSIVFISSFNDTKAVIVPFVTYYSLYINILMDMLFMFLLRYIGTRLDIINDHIVQLSEIEECGVRNTWKNSLVSHHYVQSAKNRKRVLWIAM